VRRKENEHAAHPQLKTQPEIDAYDALVLATPVQEGAPAPAMGRYLEQMTSLRGKDVACLVIGIFPAGWGQNQALAQIVETCTSKGATVRGSGSVGWWSFRRRRRRITIAGSHSYQ
jgi:multimeric flavodoxin WrbA